jgi:uncharacterized protein
MVDIDDFGNESQRVGGSGILTRKARHDIPSRYTRSVRITETEKTLYNSYSGAIAFTESSDDLELMSLLKNGTDVESSSALADHMREAGFLVPAGTDELLKAEHLHTALKQSRSMHLIVMPTEACNFRCDYCFQHFPRGQMDRKTIHGLKAYVQQAVQRLDHLTVSWYGGEPMLAFDTIAELSDVFLRSCGNETIGYNADISTNGYFLTKETFIQLLQMNVHRFMVTVDGTRMIHDRRRKLREGGGTYQKIMANMQDLRTVDLPFAVDIRINFDEDNVREVPELIDELAGIFRKDERFQLLVRPVGRWGGPHDDRIPACDRTAADTHLWELSEYGLRQGMKLSESIAEGLMPSGSVCYAAKPNSLIIGSNGQIYKCSIALEDDVNQVGKLYEDGTMELDSDKIAKWTSSGEEEDAVCRSCFFRPACQGNHCPLYRMRTGKRPCPHEKRKLKKVLNLLWNDSKLEGG